MGLKKIQAKGINFISGCILVLAVLVLAVSGTAAAYTNQGYKKGVVSTNSQEIRFSSNILRQYKVDSQEGKRAEKEYSHNFYGVSDDNYSIKVNVCNFPQGKANLSNGQEVEYDITFEVLALDGVTLTEAMYPRVKGTAALKQTFTDSLPAQVATIAEYEIVFPPQAIDKVRLKVTATPKDSSLGATSGLLLYREILPVKTETMEAREFYCVGGFVDSESVPSTDYHAFNYQIVVQNGKGKAVLTWNNSKLKMDPFFVEDMAAAGVAVQTLDNDTNYSFMEFTVDSGIQNVYDIVFYREAAVAEEDWSQIKTLVGFTASGLE